MLTKPEKVWREPGQQGKEGRPVKLMRAVSRKEFLRLGGAGLTGAMLLGTAGCNSSHGKVVRLFTGTRETAALERAVTELHVDRFEEQHPNIVLQREMLQPDEVRREIQSNLRSKSLQTSSPTTPVLASAVCWPTRDYCVPWRTPTQSTAGTSTTGRSSRPPTTAQHRCPGTAELL